MFFFTLTVIQFPKLLYNRHNYFNGCTVIHLVNLFTFPQPVNV